MKHYIVNILVAAALTLCSLASCVKENISAPDHGEGTVYLSLNVLSGGMDQVIVKSPWDPNDDNERAVENLRIYIFSKATGNLVGYKYFSKDNLTFTDDSSQPGYDRTATVSNIPTSTGEVYIYAIANALTSQYKVTDDAILNIDESNLSHLTRETFLSATCTRQLGSINPADNRFVMSGFANNGAPVTIARKDGTTQQAEITSPTDEDAKRVKLYKILSKNKITVKTGNGVTFKPEYMEIHNVPQVYGLMRGNNVAPSGFETFDRIIWSENSYQCYLPANIQTATKNPTKFNEREKNTYDASGKKTFVNAPDNATYIVLHGKYSGGDYAGDLSYTVHLGDFSKNPADFSVAANSNYEYTLTIKGVNNFIAESKKNGDDPGSEGVVIFKGTDILEVDCHYEARVMKFSMSELNQIINFENYGYILKIQTAFCETISMIVDGEGNIYDAAEFKTQTNPTVLTTVGADGMPVDASKILISGNEADFGWVRFVKNTGEYSSTPSSNPGCKVSSSHAISDVCAYPGRANTQTIFQFLRDLYKAGKEQTASYFNATGSSVYVTCFVDENYYSDKDWTEYVNKSEPRRMYFANELFVSADGQSSFARAKYVVSQKSIWTFYKLDPALKPFGLESVSEEKVQGVNVVSGTNRLEEPWDGRASAISNNRNKGFYASSTKSTGKQDIYKDAYKACMSRNRDEDGDGTINENEIKWYLASVDQYKGMWAGEEAFDADARLFKATESEWTDLKTAFDSNGGNNNGALKKWHYFTCSHADTFWAEEGCATGTDGSATMVRCIRTLASNSDGLESAETYYSYKDDVVELKLNDVALRTPQSGGFQTYFERGKDSNKLYKKFKIASANLSGGPYSKTQVISTAKGSGFINASDDVCQKAAGYGGSWRVPNQRELSIMSAVNKNLTDLYSCTSFTGVQSGYYKGGTGNEYGFVLAGTQMTVAISTTYNVRCVMDVVD
ncbi:MAG: fimbrial protein [Bacteroidales bacterium]|nr:fimbrial protein [Bacteroidales bacterium]